MEVEITVTMRQIIAILCVGSLVGAVFMVLLAFVAEGER